MTRSNTPLRLVVLVLSAAALAVFLPLWAPLVLAAWTADLVRPLVKLLERVLRGRRAAAGAITVALVLAIATPLVAATVAVVVRARELVVATLHSAAAGGPVAATLGIAPPGGPLSFDLSDLNDLLREHGTTAWRLAGGIASASVSAVVGAAVFVVGLYAFSVHGRHLYAWLARRIPLDLRALHRLVGAFRETGRGLLVGGVGTAAVQGSVAAVVYASLGVRNPLTLGFLTGAFSFVPAVGTALVWAPIAVGFAVTGHPGRAVILAGLGLGVIGTVDGVVRPWLARAGKLRLPIVVVFLSVVGGLRLFGGWGLVLGPLLVRLAVEGLAIARERRVFGPRGA